LYFYDQIIMGKILYSIEIKTGKLDELSADTLICPADEQFSIFAPAVLSLFPSGKTGLLIPDTDSRLPAGMAAAFQSDLTAFPFLVLASLGSTVSLVKPSVFRKAIYYSLLVAEANQFASVVISVPDFISTGLSETDFTENLVEMLRKFRQESGILKSVVLWIPDQPLATRVKVDLISKIPEMV